MRVSRFNGSVLLAVLAISGVLRGNDTSGDGAESSAPQLLARFNEGDSTRRTLFLYSEDQLKGVYVWLNGSWVAAEEEQYLHEGDNYHLYRVSQRLIPANRQELLVSSWSESGQTTFHHKLEVRAQSADLRVSAELDKTRTRSQFMEDKQKYEAQQARLYEDPYGFVGLLNAYRATRGLGQVIHDPGLSRDAQTNNSMGSPHAYMGAARVQNWAYGFSGASDVLRGWQLSPGHNQNLLDPSLSRAGIAESNGEWTFNGS